MRLGRIALTAALTMTIVSQAMVSTAAASTTVVTSPTAQGSTGKQITLKIEIPGSGTSSQNVRVDWGNGRTVSYYSSECQSAGGGRCLFSPSNIYYKPGVYTATITPSQGDYFTTSDPVVDGAPSTVAITIAGPAVAEPYYAHGTQVSISPIPQTFAGAIEFTATAISPKGAALCSATDGRTEISGPGPYTFTYGLISPPEEIEFTFCDGGYYSEDIPRSNPISVRGPSFVSVTGEDDGGKATPSWMVVNGSTGNVTAQLATNAGVILGSVTVPPTSDGDLSATLKASKFKPGNSTLNLSIIMEDGTVMSSPVTVGKGWSSILGGGAATATFPRCSTVYWSYDPAKAPANTKKMKKTVAEAFKMVGLKTGINFVEAGPNDKAGVRVGWGNLAQMGYGGAAGIGGTDGGITLDTRTFWVKDAYAGFAKAGHRGIQGNGFLIMHEALHVMGLGHSDTDGELMSSAGFKDKPGFGVGDLAGIDYLYKPTSCR